MLLELPVVVVVGNTGCLCQCCWQYRLFVSMLLAVPVVCVSVVGNTAYRLRPDSLLT